MTKLRNYALVLLIASFGSCDKSEDPKIVPCLLTSQVSSAGTTSTFNYDGKVMTSTVVSSSVGSTLTTFEYDAGRLTKLNIAGGIVLELTYTGDNITKQERLSGKNVLDRTEYEYSGDNLIKIQDYDDPGTGLAKSGYRTFEYFDNNVNMAREKRFSTATSTTPDVVLDYSMYGVNSSAFSAAPPEIIKYFKLGGLPIFTNILKISFNNGQEINYTYEFNDKGFPTKRTETYSNGVVNVQTNTYNCD